MFDDPTALWSDWHDSTALGKYLFIPSMCNNSFCRVKFPNCLKHNISIQMSIQSINDEWWVNILWIPIIVITFLSMAQPMKLGTNSPNLCHQKRHIILFWTWITYIKLYYIPKWNWYLIYFSWIALIKKCLHNKMSSQRHFAHVLYIRCKQYLDCIFCFVIN